MDTNDPVSDQSVGLYRLQILNITYVEESMNILYQTFRDGAKLPEISDELKGLFQKASITCLKLVEHVKYLNSETAKINEALAQLDGIVTEIEKKEQENGN